MRKRVPYSDVEDVRMLKWVVRNKWQGAIGYGIWQDYNSKYDSQHTIQSLNGRLRRNIVPKLDYYANRLRPEELASLYTLFGSRLEKTQQVTIRELIVRKNDRTRENPSKNHSPATRTGKGHHQAPRKGIKRGNTVPEINTNSRKGITSQSPRNRNNGNDDDIIEIEIDNCALRTNNKEKRPDKGTVEKRNPAADNSLRVYSIRSAISEIADTREKTFCAQTWNDEMKPVAAQGASSIYNLMKRFPDSDENSILNFVDQNSLDQLFEKMFHGQSSSKPCIVSANSTKVMRLRARFFSKIMEELEKPSVNQHVRLAVFLFFQYIEYYISLYASNTFDRYCESMNRLHQVAIELSTL